MGKKRLVPDKDRRLLFFSSVFDSISDDYPWLKGYIQYSPKATYNDIIGDHEKENFFNNRYAEILNQAVSEWNSHPTIPVEIKERNENFQCELCHQRPIIYVCTIVNKINGNELKVGNECIRKFGMSFHKDLKKLMDDQKRIRRTNILEKEIPGIKDEILRWNDGVEHAPILLPVRIVNPYLSLGEKAKGVFESFIEHNDSENDQRDIGELKEIIANKNSYIQDIKLYFDKHEADIFVPNRKIVRWLEENAQRNPEKYQIALQRLKQEGRITPLTAWRIGEPDYLRSLIPEFNRVFNDMKKHQTFGESWIIEELIQYRGIYGYEVFIPTMRLSVFCGYENFMQEFCDALFNKDADIKYDVKKLIEICTIHGDHSIGSLITNIELYLKGRYRIYQFDETMNEIIFAQNISKGQEDLYITKELRPFIDQFKYAILPSEKDTMVIKVNAYMDELDKSKKLTKQDIDFLLSQR